MHYIGPSMNPTLVVGDGLKVLPYDGRKICPGDVVVFLHPHQNYNVVHRVVRVDGVRIWTRGDNNNEDDPWVLQPEQVLGRVVSVAAGQETRSLDGGVHGQAQGVVIRQWNRTRKWMRVWIARVLHPVYRSMADSGVFRRCFGKGLQLRVVSYVRPKGVELALFLGDRHVGTLDAVTQQWKIRAPWRLVVDEASLPRSQTESTCCAQK